MSGSSTARTADLISGGYTADFTSAPEKTILPRTATTTGDDQSSQKRPSEGAGGQVTKKSKKIEKDKKTKKPKKPVGKPQQQSCRLLMLGESRCVVV